MYLTTSQLLALQSIPGVGTQSILKLVRYDAGEKGRALPNDALASCLKSCKIKTKDKDSQAREEIGVRLLDEAETRAKAILEKNAAMGISAISYFDGLFPQTLRETRDESGKKSEPPFVLFYKGDVNILKMPCVAMIGTRENTPVARKAGEYIAGNFARRGFCIVSGLAIGCDTSAHVGALNAGGNTLAFLGHGLDTVYPPQNKELAESIVENGGLLMSEYSAGTPLSRFSLVARDRLQAGISLATVVIQTGVNGGTMHAANATLNASKPLYVLGYKDRETDSHEKTRGNHLLREKGALVIRGDDNLDKICDSILNMREKGGSKSQGSLLDKAETRKKPRFIIFDLDLTLVDSSMLESLRNSRQWQEVYKRIGETRLYDGLKAVFDRIRERGLRVAIVTSAPKPYVQRMVKFHDIPCDYIVDYHATSKHKPNPEPMLHAMRLMEATPSETLSFGDRAIDIEASNAAGIPAAACLWGTTESAKLQQASPAFRISEPVQMLDLI